MKLTIGETILTATLADNSSVKALEEKLQDGPITIRMEDYARMEKVGNLPFRLPTNDQSITTQAGDLILYLGNSFVIYYAPNSWRFTRLGHIEGVTAQELKKVLQVLKHCNGQRFFRFFHSFAGFLYFLVKPRLRILHSRKILKLLYKQSQSARFSCF